MSVVRKCGVSFGVDEVTIGKKDTIWASRTCRLLLRVFVQDRMLVRSVNAEIHVETSAMKLKNQKYENVISVEPVGELFGNFQKNFQIEIRPLESPVS